jgi:hypothetical protein
MSFDPAIPGPNDLLSDSQADIQANFSVTNNVMGINHVNFNNTIPPLSVAADQGKHHVTTLIERIVGWGFDPVTAANEVALYCKDLAGVSTLYMRKESNGTIIQMSAADPVVAIQGSTFLPGGILLQWGAAILNADGDAFNFPVVFPNNCWGVTVTSRESGNIPGYFTANNIVNASFTVWHAIGAFPRNFFYIAIGN